MSPWARAVGLAIASIAVAACDESGPRIDLEITSALEIPGETNLVAVRAETERDLEERTYDLGEPPRDRWPQTLPLLSSRGAQPVSIIVELRRAQPGQASVAVGYGKVDVSFPKSGSEVIVFDVPRACEDRDGDGYGSGFGCVNPPDCDDSRPDVPEPIFCPEPPSPQRDGGVEDGGPNPPEGCESGEDTCPEGQVCFEDRCREPCTPELEDCNNFSYGCLPGPDVCVCRVPCTLFMNPIPCPGTCVEGCCELL